MEVATARVRRSRGMEKKLARWGLAFVLPAVVFFTVFSFYPIANAIAISLTDKKVLSLAAPNFVGLQNYIYLAKSPSFWNSMRATLTFTIGTFIPLLVFSLALAVFLSGLPKKGRSLQMAFYSPAVLSSVVAATIWMMMLDPRGIGNRVVNFLLNTPGTDNKWLADWTMEQVSTIMVYFWKYIGYFTVIFITGVSAIPPAVYEASTIDGASRWQSFRWITLPLLRPTIALVSIMSMLQCLKTFSTQYLFYTSNAPKDAINVITLNIYLTGIKEQQLIGRACAMSIVLLIIMLLLTWLQFKVSRSDETSY
jgi:multiple sugar transport system permease protein